MRNKTEEAAKRTPFGGGMESGMCTLCLLWPKCKLNPATEERVGGHLRSLFDGRWVTAAAGEQN